MPSNWIKECTVFGLQITTNSIVLFYLMQVGCDIPATSPGMMSQGRGRIWEGTGKHMNRLILAYLLLLVVPCMSFLPNFWSQVLTLSWKSHTHQYITEQSILNVTLETLSSTKKYQGNHAEEQVS